MKTRTVRLTCLLTVLVSLSLSPACKNAQGGSNIGAPPAVTVIRDVDITLFKVDHPEQFPLATATAHESTSELVVTGL